MDCELFKKHEEELLREYRKKSMNECECTCDDCDESFRCLDKIEDDILKYEESLKNQNNSYWKIIRKYFSPRG